MLCAPTNKTAEFEVKIRRKSAKNVDKAELMLYVIVTYVIFRSNKINTFNARNAFDKAILVYGSNNKEVWEI